MREQAMVALKRANEVRTYRKNLKLKLKAGGLDPREIVATPEPEVVTARVAEFLSWCPMVGRAKVQRTLHKLRIGQAKTLGGLTTRQRDELIGEMSTFPSIVKTFD